MKSEIMFALVLLLLIAVIAQESDYKIIFEPTVVT